MVDFHFLDLEDKKMNSNESEVDHDKGHPVSRSIMSNML